MSRAMVIINGPADREKVARWAHGVPVGTRIEFKETKRSVPQNDRFYAMLTDIAAEMKKRGRDHDVAQWKTIFMAAFGLEVKFLPSLDQKTFIPLGHSSSDLSVKEMSDLMEFMTAWAAENNVPLRDNTNTDDAAPSASTEGTGVGEASTPGPVSSSLTNHLKDFARNGFRTLSEDDLGDDEKAISLEDMTARYEELIKPEFGDDWPKFESIVTAFKAVFAGKRTVQQGREFAAEVIGCKINQIGG